MLVQLTSHISCQSKKYVYLEVQYVRTDHLLDSIIKKQKEGQNMSRETANFC